MPAVPVPDAAASAPGPVAARVARVRDRVAAAARGAGRDVHDVRLLVATKTQPVEAVRAVVAAGVDLIGENRVQELTAKLPALAPEVEAGRVAVHLIGHLQSNKVNAVVGRVACVESVDSFALARRLDRRAAALGVPLDVLVQVNVSREASKDGVDPADAVELALAVARLDAVRLRGFMTIGARTPDVGRVRAGFAELRGLRDAVLGSGAPGTEHATELSMGMSGDLEAAVAEGSTLVRVGTAVFGPRPAPGGAQNSAR